MSITQQAAQWGGWTTVTGQKPNMAKTENDSTETTESELSWPACRSC